MVANMSIHHPKILSRGESEKYYAIVEKVDVAKNEKTIKVS